jgi:hypothetical protein
MKLSNFLMQISSLSQDLQDTINHRLKTERIDVENIVYIKQVAFESEHKGYIHFIKTTTGTLFLFSNTYLKMDQNIDNSKFHWNSVVRNIDVISNLVKRSCYYRNTSRTKTLNFQNVLDEFPAMEMKMKMLSF